MPKAVDLGVTSVIDVLTNLYELDGTERGREYDILCPDPNHNDSSPSASVNLESGYWHCFSCGKGGDLAGLGAVVLGRDRDDVLELLRPSTAESLLTIVKSKISRLRTPATRRARPVKLPGPYDSGPLTDMYRRGFTRETMEKYGVRFCTAQTLTGQKGEFTIRESIAIPIRDSRGRLMAWCYRATDASPSWQPRYLYTPEVEISELWFGMDHIPEGAHVSVVEGAADAMWCSQSGYHTLGLLGSKMGDRKVMWLQRFASVTLLGDLDGAGAKWVHRVGTMLGTRVPLYVGQYRPWMGDQHGKKPRATDPQELFQVDVEIVHETAIPYHRWRARTA